MYEQMHNKRNKAEAGFRPRILVLVSDDEEDLEYTSSRYCVIEGDKDTALRHFHPFVVA